MKCYINKRGYVLIKKEWDKKVINNLRKELTVKPFIHGDFGDTSIPFKVFLENENKIYIPKVFGIQKFGIPDKITLNDGNNINLNFNGNLRPHQIEPIDKCLEAFEKKGGGQLSLPCGDGKTACGCYLISKLKKKTLVLVHKEFLVNQWIERINGTNDSHAFLPNTRIGKIQASIIDIEDKDIVIGMIQSISKKEYPLNTFDSFGFVIIDECHRIPSRHFSKALGKINCKYMLGLSATPTRKDGLSKVLKWHIGDIIFSRKKKSTSNSIVERYIYNCDAKVYCEEKNSAYGKINSAGMINQVSEYMPRTEFICKKVMECLLEERQVLILADRKNMLFDIEKIMIKNNVTNGYYIGGMKEKALNESKNKSVILATFAMAQEGLDIATIDTIILATPKTEIEQAVGRIRPKFGGGEYNMPLVIDIVDDFSIFQRQAEKRYAFFKRKKYYVETFNVDRFGDNQEKISTFDPDENKKKTVSKKVDKPAGFSFSSNLE